MKEQYLMKEERKLLECLRENYNCKTIYLNEFTLLIKDILYAMLEN